MEFNFYVSSVAGSRVATLMIFIDLGCEKCLLIATDSG